VQIPGSLDIDSIAEKCREYELVLTPYPSLADTLNSRINAATVSTPRKYASEGNENFREKVFLRLVNENGINWKKANYLLNAAISCWRHTGEPRLEEDGFSQEEMEKVQKLLKDQPSYLNNLENIDYPENIAVLFYNHMDELEKQSLPEQAEKIDVFTQEKRELPQFYIYTSAGTLVQSLIENLEPLDCEDIGIVVSSDSKYRYLIESKLEAEIIPFQKRDSLTDSDQIRTFVSLLRLSFSGKRARVKDLKPILDQLDIEMDGGNGQKLLDSIEGNLDEFKELFNTIQFLEFGQVFEDLKDFGYENEQLERILRDSGMWASEVSRRNINFLEHYIDRFAEEKRSEEGVLLADPRETVKVDRETVFFIGLGENWEVQVEEYPWISEDKAKSNYRERLASLMNSGDRQVFMVQEKEMERPVRPCNSFVEVLDRKITSFTELDPVRAKPEKFEKGEGFQKEETVIESSEVETLSQSQLNSFVMSPRLYYFSRLLEDEDQLQLEKGNLFHDFAEFYVNYPNYARDKGQEKFEEIFMEELEPFLDDVERGEIKKEVSLGLGCIMKFLDSVDIEGEALTECKHRSTNTFAKKLGKGLRVNVTELYFKETGLGASGKIDLVSSETSIVDFKSGRKNSTKNLALKSKVQTHEDQRWPDFQAPMYLSYLRYRNPEEELEFTYFYFLHKLAEQVKGNGDIEEMKASLKYYPESFDSFKSKKEVFEDLVSGVAKSNSRRKTLEKLGYSKYQKFMEQARFPHVWDKKEIEHTEFVQKFEEMAKKEVGDYKYVEDGVQTAVRKLLEKRITNYFKEDLDEFEDFLNENIDELNRYKEEGFPLNGDVEDLPEKDLLVK